MSASVEQECTVAWYIHLNSRPLAFPW
jgi:hypothetical protein